MHPPALANCRRKACDEALPSFARWRERLIAAEQGAGWLDECDDAGRFLAVSSELVDALSGTLRGLAGDAPVLEVCAGSGELARSLAFAGVRMQATDVEPVGLGRRPGSDVGHLTNGQVPSGGRDLSVLRMSAQAALRRFRPSVVLGSFVPFDAGVDEVILSCPSVRHYVVLNARIGGSLGSPALWQTSGWQAEPLEAVQPWMLTRHDTWLGPHQPGCSDYQPRGGTDLPAGQPQQPGWSHTDLLRHGEAWHFTRDSTTSPLTNAVARTRLRHSSFLF